MRENLTTYISPMTLREILDNTEMKPDTMLVVENNNCANQYKSAKSFYLIQQLSNLYNVPICRIYRVAGHGKNEVDSVGGGGVSKMQGSV